MTSMLVGWFSYLTSDVVRPRTTDKQGFEGVQPPLFISSIDNRKESHVFRRGSMSVSLKPLPSNSSSQTTSSFYICTLIYTP